jgi:hypothetical protein
MFRNLFLVLVTTPAPRVTHEDDLSSTAIVPVTSADEAAAEAAAHAAAGRLDLIELYGGLGIDTAATVLTAAPGTPVGFAGAVEPSPAVAVLFEDPAPRTWRFGPTTVATVPSAAQAPARAAELAAAGATRIELCGGMGATTAAAVRAAVRNVPVTTVLFGVESIEPAAAYRTRFAASLNAEPTP